MSESPLPISIELRTAGAVKNLNVFVGGLALSGKKADEVNRKLRGLGNQARGATRGMTGFSQGLTRSLLSMKTVLAGLGVTFFFRETISVMKDFERAMSQVAAVTSTKGTPAFQEMTDTARRLGATTVFSARQAADAMTFMGRAGFEANQIVKATPNVLNLAAAAALSMSEAADIMTSSMAAFNIAAEDSIVIADAMANIAANAKTNVQDLGQAMKFVGPVAGALGLDFEEVAASIGVLSNAGLQGSVAGTGLRRTLSALTKATPAVRKALRDAGLSITELNPRVKSITDIIQVMSDNAIDAGSAFKIFGDRGGPALLALVNQVERLKELNEILREGSGGAKEMADIMQDNLAGALKELKSAFEELILQTGDTGFLSELTDFVRGAADLFRVFGGLELSAEAAAREFEALNGKSGDAGLNLRKMQEEARKSREKFESMASSIDALASVLAVVFGSKILIKIGSFTKSIFAAGGALEALSLSKGNAYIAAAIAGIGTLTFGFKKFADIQVVSAGETKKFGDVVKEALVNDGVKATREFSKEQKKSADEGKRFIEKHISAIEKLNEKYISIKTSVINFSRALSGESPNEFVKQENLFTFAGEKKDIPFQGLLEYLRLVKEQVQVLTSASDIAQAYTVLIDQLTGAFDTASGEAMELSGAFRDINDITSELEKRGTAAFKSFSEGIREAGQQSRTAAELASKTLNKFKGESIFTQDETEAISNATTIAIRLNDINIDFLNKMQDLRERFAEADVELNRKKQASKYRDNRIAVDREIDLINKLRKAEEDILLKTFKSESIPIEKEIQQIRIKSREIVIAKIDEIEARGLSAEARNADARLRLTQSFVSSMKEQREENIKSLEEEQKSILDLLTKNVNNVANFSDEELEIYKNNQKRVSEINQDIIDERGFFTEGILRIQKAFNKQMEIAGLDFQGQQEKALRSLRDIQNQILGIGGSNLTSQKAKLKAQLEDSIKDEEEALAKREDLIKVRADAERNAIQQILNDENTSSEKRIALTEKLTVIGRNATEELEEATRVSLEKREAYEELYTKSVIDLERKAADSAKTEQRNLTEAIRNELITRRDLEIGIEEDVLSHGISTRAKRIRQQELENERRLTSFNNSLREQMMREIEIRDQSLEAAREYARNYELTQEELNSNLEKLKLESENRQIAIAEFGSQSRLEILKNNNERIFDVEHELFTSIESEFLGMTSNLADAFIDLAITGENSFRELANAFIREVARMALQKQVLDPLFETFSILVKGFAMSFAPVGGGASASGGTPGFTFTPSAQFHSGGIIGKQSDKDQLGKLTSNEVPAVLLKGEGVFTEDQMRQLTLLPGAMRSLFRPDQLMAIDNSERFHTGGIAGGVTANRNSSPAGNNTFNIEVTVDVASGGIATQTGSGDNDSNIGARLGKALSSSIAKEIREQMRPGGLLQGVNR